MTSVYKPGDVVTLDFPGGVVTKRRPAVIVSSDARPRRAPRYNRRLNHHPNRRSRCRDGLPFARLGGGRPSAPLLLSAPSSSPSRVLPSSRASSNCLREIGKPSASGCASRSHSRMRPFHLNRVLATRYGFTDEELDLWSQLRPSCAGWAAQRRKEMATGTRNESPASPHAPGRSCTPSDSPCADRQRHAEPSIDRS